MADNDKVTSTAQGAAAGASAGPWGAVIGGGLGLVSSLFGGGGQDVSGMTLPPALEINMLRNSKSNLEMLQNNIGQIDNLIKAYNQRIDLISKGIEGTIPDEVLSKEIANNSAQIALGLGADAQQLIESGFLDAEDIQRIEQLDQLSSQEFKDEAFEQEFSQQRAALEQQLLRDGRSLAEVSQTLMQFDSQKAVERQQRGEILRQGAFGRGLATLQAKSGLRQQGFQQALGALQAGQQQTAMTQNSFGNLANLAQMQQQGVLQGMNTQANFAGASQSLYNSLGQFDLNSRYAMGVQNPNTLQDIQNKQAQLRKSSAIGGDMLADKLQAEQENLKKF